MKKQRLGELILFPLMVVVSLLITACAKTTDVQPLAGPSTLPDLSGLSWVGDDLFIGVHDAKRTSEKDHWPRVSLIRLPKSEFEGIIFEPVYLDFPGPGGFSSDMESSSSIPGGKDFLFVESGQEGENYQRIFHAEYSNGMLQISDYANWPVQIENVEATEVCQVGEQLVFLYAERAEGLDSTKIRWANLSLSPLKFGEFREVVYKGIDPVGAGARPIVALEVDSEGFVYIVSTFDSGSDDGPYRSVVWQIGRVIADDIGNPTIVLDMNNRIGTLDGLKVESIAVREIPGEHKEIYFGTDDEHYGGTFRLLPGIY